jgi:hypothetical protein
MEKRQVVSRQIEKRFFYLFYLLFLSTNPMANPRTSSAKMILHNQEYKPDLLDLPHHNKNYLISPN